MKESLKDCQIKDPKSLEKGLKGPIKDSEMQKIADHYLKNNKAPGPDSFQVELIKTMPPEQLKVIQQWLNEILATGEIVTTVTEEDMTGVLSLLHKGDPLADQPSHWRPVVLLNSLHSHKVASVKTKARTSMLANCTSSPRKSRGLNGDSCEWT